MNSIEIKQELQMTYEKLVEYLLLKYGKAKYDYFSNPSCKSKNSKISRTNEGLYCHHMDEDKAIMLSKDKYAINNPFKYQKADRLVYCNIFEHLILHIKIVEEPKNVSANTSEMQGIGGVVNFICPQINDYYNGYHFKQQWLISVFSLVKENFEDYIKILKYFLDVVEKQLLYKPIVNAETLSAGAEIRNSDKVYLRLV